MEMKHVSVFATMLLKKNSSNFIKPEQKTEPLIKECGEGKREERTNYELQDDGMQSSKQKEHLEIQITNWMHQDQINTTAYVWEK